MKRRVVAVVVSVVFVVLGVAASSAYATWTASGAGAGQSSSLRLSTPTSPTATPTSASSVHIAWTPPAAPSAAPTQYVVRRTTPSTTTVCTVPGATFACDDTGLSASTSYSYTIESQVGTNWTSGQSAPFIATTNGLATFILTLPPGTPSAGTPFTVVVTATTNGTTTDVAYTGTHAVTFSGPSNSPSGNQPTYPSTITFTGGIGSATITLVTAQTVTLQASDGTRIGGTTTTVASAPPSTLGYTNSNVSCTSGTLSVGNGGSFISHISLFDIYGNSATAATTQAITVAKLPVATGALAPTSLTIAPGTTETTGTFTFTLPNGNPPDVTVTASSGTLAQTQCLVKKH
jgi:hypothetical protein